MPGTSFNVGDLSGEIAALNSHMVKYGTFSTDYSAAIIDLPKATYIVLSASIDNYVLIPYTSPSSNYWLIRQVNNTAFASQSGITVTYMEK